MSLMCSSALICSSAHLLARPSANLLICSSALSSVRPLTYHASMLDMRFTPWSGMSPDAQRVGHAESRSHARRGGSHNTIFISLRIKDSRDTSGRRTLVSTRPRPIAGHSCKSNNP